MRSITFDEIIEFTRDLYKGIDPVPLHAPVFHGNEKTYLNECIDTAFVSYVGPFVTRFEQEVAAYTGAKYAVSTVNGTSALFIALKVAGAAPGTEVFCPALTFVATANAIAHCDAEPVFIDSEQEYLGMCPEKLNDFLIHNYVIRDDGKTYCKKNGKRVAACIPVHTFGHPARIDKLMEVCVRWNIPVIEDAAESMGSLFNGKHTGTYGKAGILSFNGNKILTTGGGGMILTDDPDFAREAMHLVTTAKIPHPWEFMHDRTGYNLRMPNVNAAIGCAQLEQLDRFIACKRRIAAAYTEFFKDTRFRFFTEQTGMFSNYWLNVLLLENKDERDEFLNSCNEKGIKARPAWMLMDKLPMYQDCRSSDLSVAESLGNRIVNLPSSVTNKFI